MQCETETVNIVGIFNYELSIKIIQTELILVFVYMISIFAHTITHSSECNGEIMQDF